MLFLWIEIMGADRTVEAQKSQTPNRNKQTDTIRHSAQKERPQRGLCGLRIWSWTWVAAGSQRDPQGLFVCCTSTVAALPEGTRRATSAKVKLLCLQKDLRKALVRETLNFPCEPCRRRSRTFTEVARLEPPVLLLYLYSIMFIDSHISPGHVNTWLE